jgi:23S rRNA-/tRNA-specific pseudouridylate synthase
LPGGIGCGRYELAKITDTMEIQPAPAKQVSLLTIDAASEGQRLDNFLLRVCKGVPKTHIYRIIRSGEVRVNKGRTQRPKQRNSKMALRTRHRANSPFCLKMSICWPSTNLKAWRCMAAQA